MPHTNFAAPLYCFTACSWLQRLAQHSPPPLPQPLFVKWDVNPSACHILRALATFILPPAPSSSHPHQAIAHATPPPAAPDAP
jgi:hypothetical protein